MDRPLLPSSLFMKIDLYGRGMEKQMCKDGEREGDELTSQTAVEISTLLTVAFITKEHQVKGACRQQAVCTWQNNCSVV